MPTPPTRPPRTLHRRALRRRPSDLPQQVRGLTGRADINDGHAHRARLRGGSGHSGRRSRPDNAGATWTQRPVCVNRCATACNSAGSTARYMAVSVARIPRRRRWPVDNTVIEPVASSWVAAVAQPR